MGTLTEWQQTRRNLGECINHIGVKAVEGTLQCQRCLDYRNEYSRNLRADKKSKGICTSCDELAVEGKTKCQICLVRRAEGNKRIREQTARSGFCQTHKCPVEIGQKYCQVCIWVRNESKLKARYGMDLEDYGRMEYIQGRRCAVDECNSSRLDVDHDHETGKVRGLICNDCNHALGRIRDDAKRLKGLIEYLGKK